MKVYLDNCCYNRLFDDRSNIINYLEREAVLIIMQKAFEEEIEIVGSEVLEIEILKIPNETKRTDISDIYATIATDSIQITDGIVERSRDIMDASNIRAFDSMHLACAEQISDVLLTTDKKFLRNCKRLNTGIKVQNPIEFIMEVMNDDTNN